MPCPTPAAPPINAARTPEGSRERANASRIAASAAALTTA
jgi:hypothetical protein